MKYTLICLPDFDLQLSTCCRAQQYRILTHAVVVVCELEAGEAEAVVGSHCVFTGAVATRLSVALINV